jgi:hypothetical protein
LSGIFYRYGRTSGAGEEPSIRSPLWRTMLSMNQVLSEKISFSHPFDLHRTFQRLLGSARLQVDVSLIVPTVNPAAGVKTTLEQLAAKAVEVTVSGSQITFFPTCAFEMIGFGANCARAAEFFGRVADIGLDHCIRLIHELLLVRRRRLDTAPMLLLSS